MNAKLYNISLKVHMLLDERFIRSWLIQGDEIPYGLEVDVAHELAARLLKLFREQDGRHEPSAEAFLCKYGELCLYAGMGVKETNIRMLSLHTRHLFDMLMEGDAVAPLIGRVQRNIGIDGDPVLCEHIALVAGDFSRYALGRLLREFPEVGSEGHTDPAVFDELLEATGAILFKVGVDLYAGGLRPEGFEEYCRNRQKG